MTFAFSFVFILHLCHQVSQASELKSNTDSATADEHSCPLQGLSASQRTGTAGEHSWQLQGSAASQRTGTAGEHSWPLRGPLANQRTGTAGEYSWPLLGTGTAGEHSWPLQGPTASQRTVRLRRNAKQYKSLDLLGGSILSKTEFERGLVSPVVVATPPATSVAAEVGRQTLCAHHLRLRLRRQRGKNKSVQTSPRPRYKGVLV